MDSEALTFDRMDGEPEKAFAAFRVYRDMPVGERSHKALAARLGRDHKYLITIGGWSSQWKWAARVAKWDQWLDLKAREHAERRMPLWEIRRQQSLDANLSMAWRIRNRLEEMMAHPLTETKTKESADGKTIIHITKPASWNWNAVFQGVKIVAELEAATIAEGLLEADDEDFDIEAASADELRAFLQRHRRRRGTGGSQTPTLDQFKREG
jgi:hypothetical protein